MDLRLVTFCLTLAAFILGWVFGHRRGWKAGAFDAMKASRDIDAATEAVDRIEETLKSAPVRARTWRDPCPHTVNGKHEWAENSENYGGVLGKGETAYQCFLCKTWVLED